MNDRPLAKADSPWQLHVTKGENDESSPIYFAREGYYFLINWDRLRFDFSYDAFEQIELNEVQHDVYFKTKPSEDELPTSLEISAYQGRTSTELFNQFYFHPDGTVLASGYNRLGSLGVDVSSNDKPHSRRINPVVGLPAGLHVKKVVADLEGTVFIMDDGDAYTCGNFLFRPTTKHHNCFYPFEFCKEVIDAHLLADKCFLLNAKGKVYQLDKGYYRVLEIPERVVQFWGHHYLLFMMTESNKFYLMTVNYSSPIFINSYLDKALKIAKQKAMQTTDLTFLELPADPVGVICQPLSYHSVRALRMTCSLFYKNNKLLEIQNNKKDWSVYIDDYDIYFTYQNKKFKLDKSASGFALRPTYLSDKKWVKLEKVKNPTHQRLFELGNHYSTHFSGNRFFLADNGEVLAQGENMHGSLGVGVDSPNVRIDPTLVHRVGLPKGAEVIAIVGDITKTFFIMKNGQCYVCGESFRNNMGILQDDGYSYRNIITPTLLDTQVIIKHIVLLDSLALVLDSNGHLYRTGSEKEVLKPIIIDTQVTELHATSHWTAIIKTASNKTFAYDTHEHKLVDIDDLLKTALEEPAALDKKWVNK